VVVIGGDVLPPKRHMIVVVALAIFAAAPLLERGDDRVSRYGSPAFFLSWVFVGGFWIALQGVDAELRHIRTRWVSDARTVAQVAPIIEKAFRSQHPLIAVDQAGALPYYTRFAALDMLGLTDRYLAMHPPTDFGSGWIGHELGNGRYVLDREPDLVFFGDPLGGTHTPVWRSGREMVREKRWQEEYQPVFLQLVDDREGDRAHPVLRPFVRIRGTLGMAEAGEFVRIPPLLLGTGEYLPAQLTNDGNIGFELPAGSTAALPQSFGVAECITPAPGVTVRSDGRELELWNESDSSVTIRGIECRPVRKTGETYRRFDHQRGFPQTPLLKLPDR
jgi:arabinofuranosyltransferase